MPLGQLTRASLIIRFTAIAIVIAGIAVLFAYAGGWLTPHALTPAFNDQHVPEGERTASRFSTQPHQGCLCQRLLREQWSRVALSKASVFPLGRVPMVGRFSPAGGQPLVADALHTIRGMAILFKLSDGEE